MQLTLLQPDRRTAARSAYRNVTSLLLPLSRAGFSMR